LVENAQKELDRFKRVWYNVCVLYLGLAVGSLALSLNHHYQKIGGEMDNRKMYVRPAVESEEMLEQTSLACNASTEQTAENFPSWGCKIGVDKNGAWVVKDENCRAYFDYPKGIVVLS
jgi:hypothetical protein